MNERIVVEIDKDGKTTVDAIGFSGTSCEDATRAIEQALGAPKKRSLKPEHARLGNVQRNNR